MDEIEQELPQTVIQDSGDIHYQNRILLATPVTGVVRIEWHAAMQGQIIPVNWSIIRYDHYMGTNNYYPMRYEVADAQNLITKICVDRKFEWCLLIEHDTAPPPDAFVRFGEYMRDRKVPIISGLYYTRSRPSEPLIFRGRGNSFYGDWKHGDKVWADGVPTGCLLIHCSILQALWDRSPEYSVGGTITRRVFDTPRHLWYDPESKQYNMTSGTSDLEWCTRIMKDGIFEQAGWPEYKDKEFPFLVDTNIFCKHYDIDGTSYP